MAELTETFDEFLLRVTRKLIPRLVREEGGQEDDLLTAIRMSARLRWALDRQISSLVRSGDYDDGGILDEVLGEGNPYRGPTWKEIGEALGVTAQAAHRKYANRRQR